MCFFWQYKKASSCCQIYSDSSLKVFQAKGCLAELSLNASLKNSLGHGKVILARTARATTGLGQAGIFDFIIGASIPVEDW